MDELTNMLAHITDLRPLSVRISPKAAECRVSIYMTNVNVAAVLDTVCRQDGLLWRIDQDCIYLYSKREAHTERLLKMEKGAWCRWDRSPITLRLGFSSDNQFREYRFYSGRDLEGRDIVPTGGVASNMVVFEAGGRAKVPPVFAEQITNERNDKRLLLWYDFDGDGNYSTDEIVALDHTTSDTYGRNEAYGRVVCDAGHRHYVNFETDAVRLGNGESDRYFSMESAVGFTGTLENVGIDITAVLRDADADALFAGFHGGSKRSDFDSVLELAPEAERNMAIRCPLAPLMALGTNFYSADLHFEGGISDPVAVLALAFTNPPLSSVLIKGENVDSILLTRNDAALRLTPRDHRIRAPAGRWHVAAIKVKEGQAEFVFSADDYGAKALKLDVRSGEVAELNVGGPLTHEVEVRGAMFGGTLMLGLAPSTGIGGEKYTTAAERGSEPPSWSVVNSAGKTITSGVFEYG